MVITMFTQSSRSRHPLHSRGCDPAVGALVHQFFLPSLAALTVGLALPVHPPALAKPGIAQPVETLGDRPLLREAIEVLQRVRLGQEGTKTLEQVMKERGLASLVPEALKAGYVDRCHVLA